MPRQLLQSEIEPVGSDPKNITAHIEAERWRAIEFIAQAAYCGLILPKNGR
jgi:hypothetical protein